MKGLKVARNQSDKSANLNLETDEILKSFFKTIKNLSMKFATTSYACVNLINKKKEVLDYGS